MSKRPEDSVSKRRDRFGWARGLPKPEGDPDADLSQNVQEVQTLAAAVQAAGAIEAAPAPEPAPPAAKPRERMIDRQAGRAGPKLKFVPGKIRGGKRSSHWGRASTDTSPGDWVGLRLPPGTSARLKRLAAAHDLFVWQVIVEAIERFVEAHGETPKR